LSQSVDSRPVIPRIAGLLTQLCGAGCVLVGTVAFALLLDQMDGAYLAILLSWVGAGMLALVCGGLAGRPSPVALVLSTALDLSFCGVLFAVASRLSVWLRILSADDAANASAAVFGIGVSAGVAALASLIATPLALRYWRASEAAGGPSASGMFRGSPGTGHSLQQVSTAPGFPPPVTGAFQLGGGQKSQLGGGQKSQLGEMGPMDSGIMVAPAGTGMRPGQAPQGLQPAVSAMPHSAASPYAPQGLQPAVPAMPHSAASPYAPQGLQPAVSAMPHSAASPYAPQGLQPAVPAMPHSAASPFAATASSAPRPESVPSAFHVGAKLEPQPPLRRNPTPAPPFPQPVQGDHTPPPYFVGSQGHVGYPGHPGYLGYPGSAGAPDGYPGGDDHTPPPMMPPSYGHHLHADHTPPPHFMGAPGLPLPHGAPMGPPPFAPHGAPMGPPFAPHGAPTGPGFGPHAFRHDATPPLHRAPDFEAPAPPPRSYRSLWIASATLAVGGIVGLVVLLSSGDSSGPAKTGRLGSAGSAGNAGSATSGAKDPKAIKGTPDPGAVPGAAGSGAAPPDEQTAAGAPAATSPRELLEAFHQAAAHTDVARLRALAVPTAFGFGVRATSISRTAEELGAAFAADLGTPPAEGFTVTPSGLEIGEEGGHAWIAEELEVTGNSERRRFAITMLAAQLSGTWRIVAWHWAVRLPDETVERLAEEGDLPIPEGFDDRIAAPAEAAEAFRSAFSSTESYSLAISPRASSFNFGSAPGERIQGGDAIRRVFKRLRADIKIREGVIVSAAGSWDPAQAAAPGVAWAAANVEFSTRKSRRILRVLSILVRENDEWRLVQTQWSDGG
jgi:SnoaL-like domain